MTQMVQKNLMSYYDTGQLPLAEIDKNLDRVTLISSFQKFSEVIVIHQFIWLSVLSWFSFHILLLLFQVKAPSTL